MTSPRFDSPVIALLNMIGIAVWLSVVIVVVRDWRRGETPSSWDALAIVVNASVAGVYLPVGPLVWVISRLSSRPSVGESTHA